MGRCVLVLCGLVLLSSNSVIAAELTSLWRSELAVTEAGLQKFEHSWQPEFSQSLTDNWDMTVIGRLRFDTEGHLGFDGERLNTQSKINGSALEEEHFELTIREWYLDTEIAGAFWRIGKQQVVWGQADGLKVLDVVNPQSYREFTLEQFDDSRIPLWMVNAEIPVGEDDSLQILWIADPTYHDLANNGSDYQITSPLTVPQPVEGIPVTRFDTHKPELSFENSEIGLRYSMFASGWDLTFNYLYHYLDTPVFFQRFGSDGELGVTVEIDAEYKRNHLFGFSASKAFGDWTVRSELGYSTDTYHLLDNKTPEFVANNGVVKSQEIASVIGLDWMGLEDSMVSLQWFQSRLVDVEGEGASNWDSSLIRPRQDHIISLLYQRHFANETWQIEALVLYGVEQKDSSVQLELSHMLEDNLQIWMGADIFAGEETSLFGQFNQTDRLTVGFEWGF